MTVAAVILSATAEGALADTLGQPRVRRLVDIAWSGGALPVVVVSPDDGGAVAAALVGSEAVYGEPAAPEMGPAGQMMRGAELALVEVHDTTAFLVWPARMVWVGPETVTSLIEAHGVSSGEILRPAWDGTPGWPVLVPVGALGALRGVPADRMPPDVVEDLARTVPSRLVEVGDPGVVHDADTPFADLPPYDGPPDPPAGHTHEWGDGVEDEGVDERVPGEGRGLAPFPQAADDEAVDPG
jgi:CTP:molybdopterin cytidylyltransferase MocA